MGTLPINSQTLWAPEKFSLLIEDKIWDFPFYLLSWDFIEEIITNEAPGKKDLLIQ
jgi:hypothetical protein